MDSEHASFFAEHGWAIVSVLVVLLGGLVTIVGSFIRRLVTQYDDHIAEAKLREDGYNTSIATLSDSVQKIDRCAVKMDASITAQGNVCQLQHSGINLFMKETKKKIEALTEQSHRIETKLAKLE